MSRTVMRSLTAILVVAMLLTSLAGCKGTGKTKVGLSFSDFATERWKNEEVLMRRLL